MVANFNAEGTAQLKFSITYEITKESGEMLVRTNERPDKYVAMA